MQSQSSVDLNTADVNNKTKRNANTTVSFEVTTVDRTLSGLAFKVVEEFLTVLNHQRVENRNPGEQMGRELGVDELLNQAIQRTQELAQREFHASTSNIYTHINSQPDVAFAKTSTVCFSRDGVQIAQHTTVVFEPPSQSLVEAVKMLKILVTVRRVTTSVLARRRQLTAMLQQRSEDFGRRVDDLFLKDHHSSEMSPADSTNEFTKREEDSSAEDTQSSIRTTKRPPPSKLQKLDQEGTPASPTLTPSPVSSPQPLPSPSPVVEVKAQRGGSRRRGRVLVEYERFKVQQDTSSSSSSDSDSSGEGEEVKAKTPKAPLLRLGKRRLEADQGQTKGRKKMRVVGQQQQQQEEPQGQEQDKVKKKRPNHPKGTKEVLRRWLVAHSEDPYPTQQEKLALMAESGLSMQQVNDWFINTRRRSGFASQDKSDRK